MSQGAPAATFPKPFNLSSNDDFGKIRKQRLMQELKKKEREELTFKPKTNEAKNREVLQQILRDERFSDDARGQIDQRASRGNSGSPAYMRNDANRGSSRHGGLLGHAYSQSDLRNRNPNEEQIDFYNRGPGSDLARDDLFADMPD